MKLSIIIPFYQTYGYTEELLDVLESQITDETEVILVDDGSNPPFKTSREWVKVIRQKNGGPAKARNRGLKEATGDYIQFIDSDDLVSEDFVSKILSKVDEGNDVIEFSWKSLNSDFNCKVSETMRNNYPGCVLRTFKRSFIGNVRFNEQKDATEDEDFSRKLGYRGNVKVSVIPDYLYFYRTEVTGSNVKQFKQGLKKTKRIVYYYPQVTTDRTDILEEIKKDDETNEVILLTNRCDIPELSRYCQIYPPCNMWGHYQKGEPFNVTIIQPPCEYDVIFFINTLYIIGGIETYIYQFSKMFSGKSIGLLVTNIPDEQKARLETVIDVVKYNPMGSYKCDTLIMLRILDTMPENIYYSKSVQMCHACRTNPNWHIPQTRDFVVNVSNASKESFGNESGIVIHNPITKTDRKALILVSATRIPAPDKGRNEQRMRILAEMLNEADIPFMWFNFSEGQIPNPPKGMVNMGLYMDIQPYIKTATYLVQLSDSEAWSYSILEALVNEVPVLVCPFPSAKEMGIEDGKNGYILPFDMDFDIRKILNVPKFTYEYDNATIKQEWQKIFEGKVKKREKVNVRVVQEYNDILLKRIVRIGEVIPMTIERARKVIAAGYGKEIQ